MNYISIQRLVEQGHIAIKTGPFGTQLKATEYVNHGIPVLNVRNLGFAVVNTDKMEMVSAETLERLSAHKLVTGDIVFGRKGAVERHAFISSDENGWMQGSDCIRLRVLTDIINPRFLSYYFLTKRYKAFMISMCSHGTTMPSLNQKIIEKIEVPLLERSIQDRIVGILSVLDRRIATNQKINENLKQQAQAIFVNMFNESNTTQATISDVSLNVTDGVHNTVHDDPEGEYLLLSCKNIKRGSLNIGASERQISRDTFEKLRRRTKLSKGDVLISSVGTIGELLLLNKDPLNYEFQRSVAMVKPNPAAVSSAYLYESLLSNRAKLINSAHGAVQQCLFISDIAEFPIRIPQQDILSEFDAIVTPMLDIITANENENLKLSQLRDTLLPKLMSGEMDVSDLEL